MAQGTKETISRGTAAEQVARFEKYPSYPQDEYDYDGSLVPNRRLEDLIIAFEKASNSPAHAKAIGDKLIAELKFCPFPAQIYLAARELEPPAPPIPEWSGFSKASEASGYKCKRCQDTGFSQHWVDAEGRSWARRCRCMAE